MKLKSMVLACVASIALAVFSEPLPDGDGYSEQVGNYIWTFSVQDGEATIEQGTYPEPTGNLTLPSELGGCPVTCIGEYAFEDQGMQSVVIPESVRAIGDEAFWNCYRLKSVFFKGNAPECDPWNLYGGASAELTTFVRAGTTGWLNEGSSELPQVWPAKGSYQRPIRVWTAYPEIGWRVSFDIGDCGTRTGGGELEQFVGDGQAAIAPELTVAPECEFVGWSHAFDAVTECMTVSAIYRKDGKLVDGWNYTEKSGGVTWTFKVENAEATIVHCRRNGDGSYSEDGQRAVTPEPRGRLTIPETLGGCPVVGIGYEAFQNSSQLSAVTMPDSVRSIGSYAFAWCDELSEIRLSDTVTTIGNYAFEGCPLRSIVIPATVQDIGSYVFSSCSQMSSVMFAGDAPASVVSSVYGNAPGGLTTFVRAGSKGWKSSGSAELPEMWPTKGTYQRPIREWTTYPGVGWVVRFDLGEYGVRTGGGELEQTVADGSAAVAPEVGSADDGEHEFVGWSCDFSHVMGPMTVQASYVKRGLKLIEDVTTFIATPWDPVADVNYTVVGEAGTSERALYLEYLTGGAWQRVPASLISGELSLEAGQHAVSIPLADLGLNGRETVFRLIVREKGTSGVDVDNADGWTIDSKNRGAWRSRSISSDLQTSLFVTTFGAGELTFSWKASTEDVEYDWLEWFVDDVSQGKIGGETDWIDQSIFLDDGNEHRIEWRYRKDGSVDGGQDCGWVADVEMGGRGWGSVSETPFTVSVTSPVISLVANLTDDGLVALVADDLSATIYFTTDGSVPTAGSEEYAGPVVWEVFRTMKAVAIVGPDKWSNLIDGRDCVRITLDPELGTIDIKAVIRQSGASYGELPVPERDGCEFLGWTPYTWDWWGERFVDVVPQKDTTLFATWDVPPELILDPEGSFESIECDWTDFGRSCNEAGYFDETNLSYVVTDRLWREYLSKWVEMTPGSSNVVLSATFSGAGIVEFGCLDGSTHRMVCLVDGERTDLVCRQELVGDSMGIMSLTTKYEVKVLSSGSHRLELVLASDSPKSSYGYSSLCRIGGMKWTAAKSRVTVEFDAMGGELEKEVQGYRSGNTYGSFPALSERGGFEFLGWFTDPVAGERKAESDLVDFTATKLYAHWRTDLGTALGNDKLQFESLGATGWTGLSGVTHDGIAAASSGWLEWGETNALTTTVNGKGVLGFWWKVENARSAWGGSLVGMKLFLNVDGRMMCLKGLRHSSTNANGWLHFTLSLTNSCTHSIKWLAAIDSSGYNYLFGPESGSVREMLAGYASSDLGVVSMPGAWIDEVEWMPGSDQTDVVQWGYSAYQVRRVLPGKADPMVAWCDQRIAENPEDYDAHVRRAITRLKALSEDPVFRTLLGRYGLAFSEELMAITGTFNVDNAPLSNEAVDIVAGEAMPTLEMILADLDVIPEGWDGTVALPASQYPVDEDIYIDFADVVMAKACVHGAEAAILAAQGYDLTLDNQKMCEEVIAGTNRKKIVASDFTGSWDDCRVSKMKGFGDDGTIQLSADGKKLLVRVTMPEILPDECADAESRMLEIDLRRKAAEGQPSDDTLYLSLDLSGSPLAVYGTAVNGADWSYYDLSGAGMSMTDDGRCVLLEFDLSATDVPFEGVSGFALEGAKLVWGSWAEEEYLGSTCEVLQVVFDIESDGLEYDSVLTMESILEAHPQCATAIRDQASLDDAKLETRLALNLYEKFDIAIRSRTSGKMHFFEYDPKYDEQRQAVMKSVQLAKTALDDVVTVKGEDYICFEHFKLTNLNERVTLVPFFSGEILRDLLPPFEGDRPVLSSIPDITFAGTFPDWTMENRMEMLRKIDGVWYDGAFPPVISAPASFDGPYAEVVITDRSPEARIFYTTDSSDPAENGKEYTEPFKVFASCTIRAIAVTEQFGASEETSATVEKVFGVGDAVGSYDAAIACTSDVPWTVDMSVAHDGGEASMRSGAITSSEEWPDRNYSTMSATYTGKGTLVFWWKVSCEDDGSAIGTEYDFLGVYVNGARKYAIDGETDWERVELVFTDEGEHHIEWKYSKDDLDEEDIGDDCGWVDDIVWIPEESAGAISGVTLSTYPAVPFDWIDRHGLGPRYENGGNTFEQAAKMPSPTGKRDANGNVLSVLDEYVAGTDPQDENDTFHAEIEFEDGKAVVKWHPELSPEEAAKRVYRTFGRELLGSGEWVELIDGNTDGFNFFKTSVEWK